MHVLRRFTAYMLPHWPHILATLGATGLFVLFSTAAYWLSASFLTALFDQSLQTALPADPSLNDHLKVWTSRLLEGGSPQATLLRAALAIVAAFFLKNLFAYLQLYYVSYVEQRVIKQLRDQLFAHLLRQDLGYFQRERRGDLISGVLNDVEKLNQALNKSFTKLIRDPFTALVLVVLLFIVSWRLTLAALVIVPLVGWTVKLLAARIKRHAVGVQSALARLTGHLQETLSGVRVLKAFATEGYEARRFQGITGSHYRSMFRMEALKRLVVPLNEIVGVLIFSGILYMGGELVLVRGALDSEDFIRFLVLLFGLLNPVLILSSVATNIRMAEASGERVFRILDARPELPRDGGRKDVPPLEEGIRLENISYQYEPELPHVLRSVSVLLPRGRHVAIVGPSGSGKSTLVNLLPRFMDPSGGRVLWDRTDLRELSLQELRGRFGVVTQQVVLFHASIAENIAYGLEGVSPEAIERAARTAHAHDFIAELPEGYHTVVGEQGALFSGGQRQRISIARAFLRDPEVVILDEATSALDRESESAVNRALGQLMEGRTVISITHRIRSVQGADLILVLAEGELVDAGTHEVLLGRCRLYRDLASRDRELPGGHENVLVPGGGEGPAAHRPGGA